jgi:hypothetical protein
LKQVAQTLYKAANQLCEKHVIDLDEQQPSNQGLKRSRFSKVVHTKELDDRSATTDNIMTNLTATSEIMPSGVLSSQASRDNISQVEHYSSVNKRQKVENDT